MHNGKRLFVVVGGGTGTYTVLKGLKRYTDEISISAVVSMADSGGSTGRLRDAFGSLPVGDVRMALAALASDVDEHEELMRELFRYRFSKEEGLRGHNLGNLFLTALADITGSEISAVAAASKLLRIRGTVLPVTADNVHLVATYDDDVRVVGEHSIDDPPHERYTRRIETIGTEPSGTIANAADAAIRGADVIVLGPGDLYSSVLANCVIGGMPAAVQANTGTFVYVSNLMERPGQTVGMTVSDCVYEVERYVGRVPDVVIVNDSPLPSDAVERYEKEEGTKPVVDDTESAPFRTIHADLLSHELETQEEHDVVIRSLIRHDGARLAHILVHDCR